MAFRFRRSKKTPLGRITVTNRGVTHSVRTPIGTFSNKLFGDGRRGRKAKGAGESPGSGSSLLGCIGAVVVGFGVIVAGCCGFGGLMSWLAPPPDARPASQAVASVHAPPSNGGQTSAAVEEIGPAAATTGGLMTADTVSGGVDAEAKAPEPEAVAPSDAVSVTESTDEATAPKEPRLPEQDRRTWTDEAGTHSVVATLVNFTDTHIQLQRADDGKKIALPIASLSAADQVYVTYARTPRYNLEAETWIGKAERILDGDTIKLHTLEDEHKTVRLVGVDAPESAQRFGTEAKLWLTHEVGGKMLRVEVVDKDRYGRLLGDIYVIEDGANRWLNKELVLAGLAWHYVEYSKDIRLAQAQQVARGESAGLWVDARRIAPWDYRNGQQIETALPANVPSIRESDVIVYITDTGEKYHRSGCRHLSKSHHAIPLSRARSAYGPCGTCRPPR